MLAQYNHCSCPCCANNERNIQVAALDMQVEQQTKLVQVACFDHFQSVLPCPLLLSSAA